MYCVEQRLENGRTEFRFCKNIVDLPDVTDDGITISVRGSIGEYPISADECNQGRIARAHYAADGLTYTA